MRTPLLGILALLCGADLALAQTWPASAGTANYPAYGPSAPAAGGAPASGYNYYYYYLPRSAPGYAAAPATNYAPVAQQPVAPSPGPTVVLEAPTQVETAGPMVPSDIMPGQPIVLPPPEKLKHRSLPDGAEEHQEPVPTCYWLSVGYVEAFIPRERLTTPLVTTGSPTDVHAGALGQPGTRVLFGSPIDFGGFSGVQAEVGGFLDSDHHLSLEWNGEFLLPNHVTFRATSNLEGLPVIARPVFDVLAGREAAFVTAFPGLAAGSTLVQARSEFFTTEVNARYHWCFEEQCHVSALLGFRYMRLAEDLSVQDVLAPLVANGLTFEGTFVNPPSSLADLDVFQTRNQFYGPQIGGQVGWEGTYFFANAFAEVALGATDQTVMINGLTTATTATGPRVASGGILALSSNIGTHSRTVFGVVPETGLNLGVRITPHVSLTIGYSFLLWNEVVRPGAQIDRFVNPELIPSSKNFGPLTGPERPIFSFHDESFLVHSFTCGLGFQY